MSLAALLGSQVKDPDCRSAGRLSDVVVHWTTRGAYPAVRAIVVKNGKLEVVIGALAQGRLVVMVLLFVANAGLTVSEFAGIGAAMEIFGVSRYIAVPIALAGIWAVTVSVTTHKLSACSW